MSLWVHCCGRIQIFRLDTPFLVSMSYVIKFVYIFFIFSNWPISEVVCMTQKSAILF